MPMPLSFERQRLLVGSTRSNSRGLPSPHWRVDPGLLGLSAGDGAPRIDDPFTRAQRSRGETMNEEIQTLMLTYQRSLNEANLDLVGSVYADDAVFIGQPFPTATGKEDIVALYADFLSKLDFNVEFDILEVELADDLGFIRTQSVGTIVPKGQTPGGTERNREIFVVKKIDGAWRIYRYIFNPEV
ncbi:MAG: SgcJ/EcaC family oxidoreductase [Polyangiaceae bacterium]